MTTNRTNIYESAFDMIGNTPYIDVSKSVSKISSIYGKLESTNPFGSVKDRAAFNMIATAEANGTLRKGMTVIEPTSGNTGIALAAVCVLKGYPFVAVLPDNSTAERIMTLKAYGATVVLSEGSKGPDGAVEKAREIISGHPARFLMPYQYGNPANPLAHVYGTGPEILEDIPDITDFVAAMGTSGTMSGVGSVLRAHCNAIGLHGVQVDLGDRIPGIRNYESGSVPEVYTEWGEKLNVNRTTVSSLEAHAASALLLKTSGILAGPSTGAAFHVAMQVADSKPGSVIVFIVCDRGNNYLSEGQS